MGIKGLKGIFLLWIVLSLGACAGLPGAPDKAGVAEPRVALVLGGGAARGFAHVGVIRVLEQEKIPIHMIVGTSVGALIGGLYAANPDSFQLEWLSFGIEKDDLFDFSVVYSRMGPVLGERLEKFVRDKVKIKNIEELKIPFYPVATELANGNTVVFERGSLARAIRASTAIPGLFQPVEIAGKLYVDGGVTDNLPVDIARARGANIIIAVNIQKNIYNTQYSTLLDVVLQSINIMGRELVRYKSRGYDVLIEPAVGEVGTTDFSQKKRLMEAGIHAARTAVPQIQTLIRQKGKLAQ
jgi:NTE family protein